MFRIKILEIDLGGATYKAMSVSHTALRLACGVSTVRKYLRNGRLLGTQVFDEKANRLRQYVFFDSILSFTAPKHGRAKRSRDKTGDRTKRQQAARANGRLGGLANKGGTKHRRTKQELLSKNKSLNRAKDKALR